MRAAYIALRARWFHLFAIWMLMLGGCDDDAGGSRPDGPRPDAGPALAIRDARRLALGTQVTVTGTVTVAPEVFEAFTGDKGFAIQDESGGVYIRVADKVDVEQGDLVRVTGELGDLFQLLTVTAQAGGVARLGAGSVPLPHTLTAAELGESTQGRLVRLQGTIAKPIMDDLPYGYRLVVEDGSGEVQVFVSASAGFDPFLVAFLRQGQAIEITGFSGQFGDYHEVVPRALTDIIPAPARAGR